jgi:hypothetical protein
VTSKRQSRRGQRLRLTARSGAALAAATGLPRPITAFRDGLTRASYDFPFFGRCCVPRKQLPAAEVRMERVEDLSHQELKQPMNCPGDRSLHAQLMDRLTAEGSELIVFETCSLIIATGAAWPPGQG